MPFSPSDYVLCAAAYVNVIERPICNSTSLDRGHMCMFLVPKLDLLIV